MTQSFRDHLDRALAAMEADGLLKREREITGPQGARVMMVGREVLNLCANNYLGLASDPRLAEAARDALENHGYGLASVRFICGTQGFAPDAGAPARALSRH